MSRNHNMERFEGVRPALSGPLSQTASSGLEDDELALELDEPPDHRRIHDTAQTHVFDITSPAPRPIEGKAEYARQPPTPLSRQCSLLTQGLLSASQDSHSLTSQMARANSQASAYSLTSNHGLTSDGGLSSPAHSGTPSPPLPAGIQTAVAPANGPKPRTIKFAGEKPAPPQNSARKACISFACAPSRVPAAAGQDATSATAAPAESCKRPTIRFACSSKPITVSSAKPVTPPRKQTPSDNQSTPRRGISPFPGARRHRGSQSTPVNGTIEEDKNKMLHVPELRSSYESRKLEKERLKKLASTRPEDEAWINEKPKARKPLTVTDTLRKENAIRQLAAEAEEEAALEEALDDMIDEDEEDEDNDPATGSRYMAFEDFDGGHETDDEGGFAESDEESDDDPDFQFWTNGQSTAATSADHHHQHIHLREPIRPHHQRTVSESSFDGAVKHDSSSSTPFVSYRVRSHRRRSPKAIKMRPCTPELPDSTDFVCGTLDEDKPLEDAYMSCLKLRKLERQGIIPQDFDPSFPTSDPENNDEEDEVTEGIASTVSDHHFLGGRFDESDASQERGRGIDNAASVIERNKSSHSRLRITSPVTTQKVRAKSPAPVAMQRTRTKSPAPVMMQRMRTKSPAPVAMQRVRTKSPAPTVSQRLEIRSPALAVQSKPRARSPAPPRKLFDHSPIRPVTPLAAASVVSPPASPKNLQIRTAGLGQRPGHVKTASLPHTPNPFFIIQERRMRAAKRTRKDPENHDRGPIDIKQGLEERKQRRKEHYWRKHCRDHKDKSRRCAPGKGAERMRELGLEMAHRNKAYGQKLELMLSV